MLSFARKSSGPSCTGERLDDLLDRCIELASTDYDLEKKYDFRQIDIVREYDKTLPNVACEAGKIQQALLNVLSNGAQAMFLKGEERRGKGEAWKPRFVLRLIHEEETDSARIEIQDNGPGMDEATRKRIFEPFFTTKPVGVGTGLGLSVSYFIITENHGGDMSVESQPGKGATFVIRLPLSPVLV